MYKPRKDRRCLICKQRKPLKDFTKNKSKTWGYDYECKKCRAEIKRDKMLHLKRFGIKKDEYFTLLDAQNGVCAICGRKDKNALAVDHNHETGKIRSLLCRRCNILVGYIESLEYSIDKVYDYINSF